MIAPYLLLKISFLLPGFNLITFLATIVFSLVTSFKDPGIIPRYALLKAINEGVIPDKFTKKADNFESNG